MKSNACSKPGRRVYAKINDLPRVFNGLGISIISTPRGLCLITKLEPLTLAVKCSVRYSDTGGL